MKIPSSLKLVFFKSITNCAFYFNKELYSVFQNFHQAGIFNLKLWKEISVCSQPLGSYSSSCSYLCHLGYYSSLQWSCLPGLVNWPSVGSQSYVLLSPYPLLLFFIFLEIGVYLFIYLFSAVLGLRFCARAFSGCGKRGPLFIAVRGPLTIAASLVAEHRLQTRRLSSCGSRAQLLRGMWDLPRPGPKPVRPALAGRLSITAPPGKPSPPFILWLLHARVQTWSNVDCCEHECRIVLSNEMRSRQHSMTKKAGITIGVWWLPDSGRKCIEPHTGTETGGPLKWLLCFFF